MADDPITSNTPLPPLPLPSEETPPRQTGGVPLRGAPLRVEPSSSLKARATKTGKAGATGSRATKIASKTPSLVTVSSSPTLAKSKASQEDIAIAYNFFPKLDGPPLVDARSLTITMNSLMKTLEKTELTSQKKEVKASNDKAQAQHKKVIKKIKDNIEKAQKQKSMGLIGKILGWIGTIVAVIVGVVATIATGGSAWPLLAMSLVGLGTMILTETGAMNKIVEGIGKGFAQLLEDCGVPKDKAKEAGQYLAVATVIVVMVTANIVAAVASGGSNLSESAAMIFQVTRLIDSVVQASLTASQGGVDVAKAVYGSQATQDLADEASIKAKIKQLTSNRAQIITDMKRTQKLIQNTQDAVYDMLKSFHEGEEMTIEQMV